MNKLTVTGKQLFMGKEIPVVLGGFGADKRSICDKAIAEIHGQPEREIRRRITDNLKRFHNEVDYIDLAERVGDSHTLELLQSLGYAKQSVTQAEHIYILSERGYSKLIKIMDTDLAWEIHDKIMDEYFLLREQRKPLSAIEMMKLQSQALLELDERTAAVESKLTSVAYKVDNQIIIDHGQQQALQAAVGKKVYERAAIIYAPELVKQNVKLLFPAIYRDLKNRFGVASYRDIRRIDLGDAIKYTEAWIEPAAIRSAGDK